MAQGITTINNYMNNYGTLTTNSSSAAWAIGTAVWNTSYYNIGTPTAITLTMPSYTLSTTKAHSFGQGEIRICFKAGANTTMNITWASGQTHSGVPDLSFSQDNYYEISIAPITASHMAVTVKEWTTDAV